MLTKNILGAHFGVTTGYPSAKSSQPRDGARRDRRLNYFVGETSTR